MNRLDTLKVAVSKSFERMYEYEFLIAHRLEARFFSRSGKLSLPNTMMILLNFAKKSIQSEVNNFFCKILGGDTVTKQAFQCARDQISYTAFQELFEQSVEIGLSPEDTKLYHGFRLLAVDGSTLMLESTDELRDYFGQSTPVKNESYARTSMTFDILNEFIVDARIEPYSIGERQMAMEHVKKIGDYLTGKYLLLMDRGYWKRELFEMIEQSGNSFLLRVPKNSSKALNSCKGDSGFFDVKYGKSTYALRYYRFLLKNGEPEILVTNLSQDVLPDSLLCELYFMRWGIETKFHELKNLLLIENFTGKSVLSVKQDFFATVLISNFVAFAAYTAKKQIDEKHGNKHLKYDYKPNKNSIISALREHMIAAVVSPSPFDKELHRQIIENTLSQNPIPIRPHRNFPRKDGSHRYNLHKPKKVL